nr:GGDEF domain-containing protein [Motiliproteus sp. SC1-56]
MFRPLNALLFPLALTLLSLALLPGLPPLPAPWPQALPWLPLFLGVPMLLLAWHFNNSRALLACLLALLGYTLALQPSLSTPLLKTLVLLLLPLNLLLISIYRERGILSPPGLLRFALVLAQGGLVLWASNTPPPWLHHWLYPQWGERIVAWSGLPAPVLATLALGALILLVRAWRSPGGLHGYLLATLVLSAWPLANGLEGRENHLLISLTLALWLLALLKRSHEMAYIDELTGLPGRRALEEARLRLGRKHSVAMLDVDHFKAFNDRYGHDVGDQVLKLVASRLARVRPGKAYRYGGEEFCILFPRRRARDVLEPLERVRQSVADAELQLRGPDRPRKSRDGKKQRGQRQGARRTVSVTISIGVAEARPRQDSVKQADQALYRAKKQGRNRVCL